ncbi:MAG: hypothetical protein MR419_00685 [Clostridiales bacterium]|nr:hypothetical protein [Clostridiales bacterium]MDY4172789.1 hypothetical protein [Evtepia sp.]
MENPEILRNFSVFLPTASVDNFRRNDFFCGKNQLVHKALSTFPQNPVDIFGGKRGFRGLFRAVFSSFEREVVLSYTAH